MSKNCSELFFVYFGFFSHSGFTESPKAFGEAEHILGMQQDGHILTAGWDLPGSSHFELNFAVPPLRTLNPFCAILEAGQTS